jgi:hypothetical protein
MTPHPFEKCPNPCYPYEHCVDCGMQQDHENHEESGEEVEAA